ncbi:3-dehydroquinate dehydratase [Burkholderia pseudomallei]|nr:3-dehydroquinate dehydratase [Burkholderia pseudomallei]ARK58345.1 3-dehydroquinate dehydratase [Burkholderia pseudomallei]RPE11383.1 3-dehydroquinate dehydratase [Burkholderia pseudomallei]RPE18276.1 3-dehydroquinate dehydratase [Burkholderia pseudomallei]RQS85920.1 3-dehydroquinate dehydratase [Burkholderia pseudomallei]
MPAGGGRRAAGRGAQPEDERRVAGRAPSKIGKARVAEYTN